MIEIEKKFRYIYLFNIPQFINENKYKVKFIDGS